jgi:hypothetical protein
MHRLTNRAVILLKNRADAPQGGLHICFTGLLLLCFDTKKKRRGNAITDKYTLHAPPLFIVGAIQSFDRTCKRARI